jgi:hypothetical protein
MTAAPPASPPRPARGKDTPARTDSPAAPARAEPQTAPATEPPSEPAAKAPLPASTSAADASAEASPAPPVAAPTPSEPLTPPAPADPELAQLLAAWPTIVAQLSAHPPTKPLIVACRPVAVDGAIVTLGFPEEQAFLKDAAERRRPAIEAGISAAVGHPVTVRCVVANVELPAAAPDAADASFVLAEARRIFADDIVDVGEIS